MSSTTLPVCPKTGSTSPSLTVHLCLHTAPGNRECAPYNCENNRKTLYGEQGGHCAGCTDHFEPRHLEVDHIIARKRGGTAHLGNLQLLCGNCNRIKGDRGMEYLRVKLQLSA